MPLADRADLLNRLQQTLASGPPIGLAVLFGSSAAGRTRADSDVDVAIQPRRPLTHSELQALTSALAHAASADVDLVELDSVSTLLRWQIATHGIPLVERTPGDFARFRARAAAEYIDFAPALAHHGEVFRRRLVAQGNVR
jgi:predicted nucleotidyltransferase